MKYDKIAKSLKGEELMLYLMSLWRDKKYEDIADTIWTIERTFCGKKRQELYSILEDMVQNDREFVEVCPSQGIHPTKDMKFVCGTEGVVESYIYVK